MIFPLFSPVILFEDLHDTNLVGGALETIVEHHPATNAYPEGCAVECFAGNGEPLAAISVPATALRQVTRNDLPHVRQVAAA
jgi:hypothetical protein